MSPASPAWDYFRSRKLFPGQAYYLSLSRLSTGFAWIVSMKILVLAFFIVAGSAAAFDVTLSGEDKPQFQKVDIYRQCGSKVEERAVRVLLQPKTNLGFSSGPVTEIILVSDSNGQPEMSIVSEKLLQHLKTKKSRVLSVVYKREGKGLFFDKDAVAELKPCLIDGKPVTYWVPNLR